jgi:hypothetical protein
MQVFMQWVESQQHRPGRNGMIGIHCRGHYPPSHYQAETDPGFRFTSSGLLATCCMSTEQAVVPKGGGCHALKERAPKAA